MDTIKTTTISESYVLVGKPSRYRAFINKLFGIKHVQKYDYWAYVKYTGGDFCRINDIVISSGLNAFAITCIHEGCSTMEIKSVTPIERNALLKEDVMYIAYSAHSEL